MHFYSSWPIHSDIRLKNNLMTVCVTQYIYTKNFRISNLISKLEPNSSVMPAQQTPGTVDELIQFISTHSDGIESISKHIAPTLKQLPPQFFLQGTLDNRDPLDLFDHNLCSLAYSYFL